MAKLGCLTLQLQQKENSEFLPVVDFERDGLFLDISTHVTLHELFASTKPAFETRSGKEGEITWIKETMALSAGSVEYTNFMSTSVLDITLNNKLGRLQ